MYYVLSSLNSLRSPDNNDDAEKAVDHIEIHVYYSQCEEENIYETYSVFILFVSFLVFFSLPQKPNYHYFYYYFLEARRYL